MTPRYRLATLALLTALALTGLIIGQAEAIPGQPLRLYGSIDAPAGVAVVAVTAGVSCVKAVIASGGQYVMNVPADDQDTTLKQGGTNGDSVSVFVDLAQPSTIAFPPGGGFEELPVSAPGVQMLSVAIGVSSGAPGLGSQTVTASGAVTAGGTPVSGAAVNINWGDGTACSDAASAAGSGAFSAQHSYTTLESFSVTAVTYKSSAAAAIGTDSVGVVLTPGPTSTATPVPTATPIAVSEVEEATTEEAKEIIEQATTEEAAAIFEELTAEKAVEVAEALGAEKAAEIFEELADETAASIIEQVNATKAAEIIEQVDADKAAEIIESVDAVKAADIVENVETDKAADIIESVETDKAADIVENVETDKAADIIESVETDKAADIIENVETDKAADIVEDVETDKAADIIESVEKGKAADIVVAVSTTKASDILSEVAPVEAGAILEKVPAETVTEIVQVMPEEKLIERLPEMSPAKLFQIPEQVLFDQMPTVPVEQLAFEVPPEVDPDLPPPTAVQVTPTLAIYTVPATGELKWATLVGSPSPIDKIMGKFIRRLADVRVSVEDLDEKPSAAPDFGPDQAVNALFRIAIENAAPEDISAAHVTFFVDKSWLETNDIHKWSIQLNRLDQQLNAWVPVASKRVREDEERVFYTTVLPGFSMIAVTGSKEIPQQPFQASDLDISPSQVVAGEEVTVSFMVTNTGAQPGIYPASLWIDGGIESTRFVPVEGGTTIRVAFAAKRSAGTYDVRVDRLLGQFVAGEPPTPTPTQTPTQTPIPVTTTTPVPPLRLRRSPPLPLRRPPPLPRRARLRLPPPLRRPLQLQPQG